MKKTIITTTLIAGAFAFLATVPANAHRQDRLPKGTVIAYIGTETSAPDGWGICGHGNDFPSLEGRVLLGTHHIDSVGEMAGAATHEHVISIRSTDERNGHNNSHPEGGDNWNGTNWSHRHHVEGPTSKTSHIPPAIQVLFLCKL